MKDILKERHTCFTTRALDLAPACHHVHLLPDLQGHHVLGHLVHGSLHHLCHVQPYLPDLPSKPLWRYPDRATPLDHPVRHPAPHGRPCRFQQDLLGLGRPDLAYRHEWLPGPLSPFYHVGALAAW